MLSCVADGGGSVERAGLAVSGIAEYGTAHTLAGVTLAAFSLPTAQAVLHEAGQLDTIDVLAAIARR